MVKDVVLDRSNGCMAYTVLSAGGNGARVTGQGKLVAVPWSVYSVSPDMSYLTVQVERDRIYNGPVFEYSRIGDPAFTSTVYSTWGVSAGVGVSSSTTTTGATTQTQAGTYASPSKATRTKVGASPGATSPRHKGGTESMRGTGTESSAETTGSPSGHGAKGSKKSSGTEKATSAEKPTGTTGSESPETGASPSGKKSSHKKSSEGATEAVPTPGGEQE